MCTVFHKSENIFRNTCNLRQHVKLKINKAVVISVGLALLACRLTVQQTITTSGDKSTCPLSVACISNGDLHSSERHPKEDESAGVYQRNMLIRTH